MQREEESKETLTVGIVGLGLIGGSIARRLASSTSIPCRVLAWNRESKARQEIYSEAHSLGITCVATLEDLAQARPDVLMLANALKAMPEVLSALAKCIDREHTTLTDVGSVKALVREQVEAAGLGDLYVGAHPMAGSEHTGWRFSSAQLLDHALWVVTVDEHTQLQRVRNVLRVIVQGCKNRAIVLDDATHDQSAALISHMPHVVATALANTLCESSYRSVALLMAAGSWRDMTRVALTDPKRTEAMVEEDADNVARLLRTMSEQLAQVATMLECGNTQQSEAFFMRANQWRLYKHACSQREQTSYTRVLPFAGDAKQWLKNACQASYDGEVITQINEQSVTLLRDARMSMV